MLSLMLTIKKKYNNNKEEIIKNVSDEMVADFAICGSREEAKEKIMEYQKILSLPILSAPHYYLDETTVRYYQDQILETFKIS